MRDITIGLVGAALGAGLISVVYYVCWRKSFSGRKKLTVKRLISAGTWHLHVKNHNMVSSFRISTSAKFFNGFFVPFPDGTSEPVIYTSQLFLLLFKKLGIQLPADNDHTLRAIAMRLLNCRTPGGVRGDNDDLWGELAKLSRKTICLYRDSVRHKGGMHTRTFHPDGRMVKHAD